MAETSREAMREQYGDDRNLAARQAIYRFRRPGPDLFRWALDLADLRGGERVLDVGCGNGNYLAMLGGGVGLDLSAGMAAAARARSGRPVAVGDVEALPLRSGSADVVLCMHVLYHLPDQAAGAAELRRVLRPGGRALVLTNSLGHVRELDALAAEAAGKRPARAMYAFTMETGADVLRTAFDSVVPHLLVGALEVTDADAVGAYVRSAGSLYGFGDWQVDALGPRVQAVIDREGAFEVTTSTGCFVCS